MSYKYIETNIKKAPERIRCDATESFRLNLGKELTDPRDLMHYMKFKTGFIEAGKDYVEHLIVDEDTGEECALNSGVVMDKVCIRNKLYPSVIINQLK